MILFSPARGAKATATLRADSVEIANHNPAQVTADGTPQRFRAPEASGVSDHWPLVTTVDFAQKQ